MNSTPVRPTSTMRLTALLPPPPTPITLIFAPRRAAGSSVSRSSCASRSSDFFMSPPVNPIPRQLGQSIGGRGGAFFGPPGGGGLLGPPVGRGPLDPPHLKKTLHIPLCLPPPPPQTP